MFEHERRRHHRFTLRLCVLLRRGDVQLSAEIINASQSGCLLLVGHPLEPGEVLGASLPELQVPEARLRVLRCHADPLGYLVATCFESLSADEASIARLSAEQQLAGTKKHWLC